MQTLAKNFLKANVPLVMPKKKILAIDIGGTLAKTAFYIPKEEFDC